MWLEFEIETINKQHVEMGLDTAKVSRVSINIKEVIAFYDSWRNTDDEKATNIELSSGEKFVILMDYDNFKKIICE